MRKKVTDEEIAKIIGELADRLRSEMDHEFGVAISHMWLAERELVDSLNPEQLKLFEEYSEKRDLCAQLARERYQRKF